MAKPTIYGANALLGGADGALDSIDGAILVDKDVSVSVGVTQFAPHYLDAASGAGENSPLIVAPDTNPGAKRWILKGGVFAGLHVIHTSSPPTILERITGDTSGFKDTVAVRITTSGNMANGFGGGIVFQLQDDAEVVNDAAAIYVSREGGDTLGDLLFRTGGTAYDRMILPATGALLLLEQAVASANIAAYGQIWTKNDAPNTLWFENDVGGNYQIGGVMGSIVMANNGTIGQAAGPLLTFDDTNNFLEITGCRVGIGATSPIATNGGLDISSGGLSLIIGADNAASSRTNATEKSGRFCCAHYTNAEKPLGLLLSTSGLNYGYVFFGGGSALFNAATEIRFYTAANNVTPTGTLRGTFNSAGDFNLTGSLKVDNVRVVSNQGAAVANATDPATTMARLNDLLARCRAHGLIAT